MPLIRRSSWRSSLPVLRVGCDSRWLKDDAVGGIALPSTGQLLRICHAPSALGIGLSWSWPIIARLSPTLMRAAVRVADDSSAPETAINFTARPDGEGV